MTTPNKPTDKSQTFLFYRADGGREFFYAVDLPSESEVLPNVEVNPGTTKVTTLDGRVIWRMQ